MAEGNVSPWPARFGFLALVGLMLFLGYSSYQGDGETRARRAREDAARKARDQVEAPALLGTTGGPPGTHSGARSVQSADTLLQALRDPRPAVRRDAIQALAERREPRAVEPLVLLLRDPEVRWPAAQALAEIGGPRAEAVLLDALRQGDHEVMAGAHEFYLRQKSPALEPALLALLQKSGDLALAQAYIVMGSPRLAAAGRSWAAARGFTLVKTPSGYTWSENVR